MVNIYSTRLRDMADLLDKGNYLEAKKYIIDSPAGDGWGSDDTYIDFSDLGPVDSIGDVVNLLQQEDRDRAVKELEKEIERIKNS